MAMLELGVPAMWLAGLAASPHCGLMCGPLQQLGLRRLDTAGRTRMLLALHAGRVAGYAAMGALSGALGLLVLRELPSPRLGLALQAFAAVLLIAFAVRVWQQRLPACCQTPRRLQAAGTARGLASGLAWALMPCAPLYLALGAAAISGSALQGAALLAAFALGTMPLLAASAWGLASLQQLRASPRLGVALPLAVALSGLAGVALAPVFHSPWCLP